jgi:lysozyme family protein
MNFDRAFDRLIGNEGAYSFNAADPGGETMWGITARVARANGYMGDMKALARDAAGAIYKARYWDAIRADELPALLRFEVFDAAVNSGVQQAVRWLQRAAGVTDDGVLGPMTLAAVHGGDPLRLALAFNGERLELMTSLPTWGSFGRGWARRIAANLQALAAEKDDS